MNTHTLFFFTDSFFLPHASLLSRFFSFLVSSSLFVFFFFFYKHNKTQKKKLNRHRSKPPFVDVSLDSDFRGWFGFGVDCIGLIVCVVLWPTVYGGLMFGLFVDRFMWVYGCGLLVSLIVLVLRNWILCCLAFCFAGDSVNKMRFLLVLLGNFPMSFYAKQKFKRGNKVIRN